MLHHHAHIQANSRHRFINQVAYLTQGQQNYFWRRVATIGHCLTQIMGSLREFD